MFRKRVLSTLLCLAVLLTGMSLPVSVSAEPSGGIAGLEAYLQSSTALPDDGYLGIPVDLYLYHNGATTDQTPVILYVINTNTERIGTDSDFSIVNEMLSEKGYIVVVLDYKNNEQSVSPGLDWSIQGIRTKIDSYGMYLGGAAYKKSCAYVVPSGYNVTLDEYYWSIDKHGADGVLDMIVNVWNNDFKAVYGDETIHYSDGTAKKVREVTAASIYDCVKKDGTPLDMDLRMDIIYPTKPAEKVPVYSVASSAESRVATWTSAMRPHLTGFLFSGYAGVIFDYAYVPMARDDHYGYFDGNTLPESVTGDNYTYSVHVYSGIKSDTAAIRKIRYLADYEGDTYHFDVDKIGVYGNSKGGLCTRLGAQNPETLAETRYFEGHHGETRYENGDIEDDGVGIIDGGEEQPWLTYSDGTPIPSNVQFVYANCGGGAETIREGHAPTYATGSMLDGSYYGFYPEVVNNCRIYDVPLLNFSCPELGHALGYGTDKDYGIDVYDALFDFAGYWLKGDSAQCEYIDITGGTENVPTDTDITLKFTGAIPEEEIKKVTVQNDVTGEYAGYTLTPSYGNTTWTLHVSGLLGGYAYTVHVPEDITAENGKPLKEAKSLGFVTVHEQKEAASRVAGASGMTLAKTESTDDGVYFVFDNADCSASTTTYLSFDVENDAANRVLVYAIDELDESNIENSTQGALLGEIALTGAGSYRLDITEHIKSLGAQKPAFVLRAANRTETKVISDYHFESESAVSGSPAGVSLGKFVKAAVSAEQNHTAGGSQSIKFDYMTKNDNAYFAWLPFDVVASFPNLIKGSALDATDLGRKFHISMSVYDTTSREIKAELTKTSGAFGAPDTIDWNATRCNIITEPGAWRTYSLDYRIDNPIYWSSLDKRTLSITAEPTGQTDNYHPMYLDDVTVTEEITAVTLSSAPSLVLHPAATVEQTPLHASYVESGPRSGESFAGSETLLVNGSCPSVSIGSYKKVYARFPLDGFSGMQDTEVTIDITNDHDGELYVYGVADPVQAAAWSAGTIHSMNAPANDRFGFGADVSGVYGGAPIAVIHVSGIGSHTIDITEYASYIQDLDGAYATLIFAMNSESDGQTVKLTESFENGSVPFAIQQGGDIISHGISPNEDHTTGTGSSYMMNTAFGYDRLKFDLLDCASLSSSDIGKRFTVTYWLKSDKTGSFFNSLLFRRGANENLQTKVQQYTTANEWQQFTYSFTLTEDEIPDNATADNISSWINFNLDGMGARADGGTEIVCAYIDDITVTGSVVGDVTFEIAPGYESTAAPVYEKTIDFDNLTEWRVGSSVSADEVNGSYDMTVSDLSDLSTISLADSAVTADHTTGTGKSLRLSMSNLNRYAKYRFFNLFDHNLTEEDIGRTFTVSFWAKRENVEGNAAFYAGLSSATGSYAGNTFFTSGLNPDLNTINAGDGEWKQFSYTITVEEDMLASSAGEYQNPALFTLRAYEWNNTFDMYIDDLTVTETTEAKTPYRYSCDWEGGQAVSGTSGEGAVNPGGFNWTANLTVSPEENHTAGEGTGKSLKFAVDGNGYRIFLNQITGTGALTAADIGKNYRAGFWMKADKAGTFQLSMTNTALAAANQPPTYPNEKIQTYTVPEADVGLWKKYTYDFTVTPEMVAAGANQLLLRPDSGTNGYNAANPATLYIDDITSAERIEGATVGLGCDQSAVVSNRALDGTEALTVSRSGMPAYVRKAYLHYAGSDNQYAQKAELTIHVTDAGAQTLNVYGITGFDYPNTLTYDTAPGSNADESMDANAVYGGKPLAQIQLDGPGSYTVDVTGYIRDNAPNDNIFAFTSDASGGTAYTNLDFETFGFAEGVDYSAFGGYAGTVGLSGGAARVNGITSAGEGIKILNLFGSGNASCKAGETYTVSADVTPYGADGEYDIVLGLCAPDADVASSAASAHETIAVGVTKRVSFTFTASGQEAADGLCALAVYAASAAPEDGLSIDNVSVSSNNPIQLAADATLQIDKPQQPEAAQMCDLYVSALGSGTILYSTGTGNQEELSTGAVRQAALGSEISLMARPLDGAKFLYWVQTDTGRIVSETASYTFAIGSDTDLTAIFTDNSGGKLVIFKNGRSRQIVSGTHTSGRALVPAAPYVMGYEFTGWLKDGAVQAIQEGDTVEVTDHTVFTAAYTQSAEQYHVIVENGSGSGAYRYNDPVTAVASAPENGKKFSHWEREGKTVSYDETYRFYVTGNMTITAIYTDAAAAVEIRPILVMSTPVILAEENKIAFFAERDLPEEYTLIETGILLGQDAGLTLGAPDTTKTVSITGANQGQLTVRKADVVPGEIWYGRAYMVYRDGGTVKTVYSDVVSGVLQ